MLSIDLTHLPIKTKYDLFRDKFKPAEIAEAVLQANYNEEWKENWVGFGFKELVYIAKRKDLIYVAGLDPEANVLIIGHPSPDNGEFVDPTELRLDNILKYTPLQKIE